MQITGRFFSFTLLVLVFAFLLVASLTGIPIPALADTGFTALGCLMLIGVAHYAGVLRFTISSASAGVYWLKEGKGLMLAKANDVGESTLPLDYAVNGQNLPWYTTDWFQYVVVLLLFVVAILCFKNGK